MQVEAHGDDQIAWVSRQLSTPEPDRIFLKLGTYTLAAGPEHSEDPAQDPFLVGVPQEREQQTGTNKAANSIRVSWTCPRRRSAHLSYKPNQALSPSISFTTDGMELVPYFPREQPQHTPVILN